MRMIDLFAGIGVASLAAETVFPGIEHEFVEINPFSQTILQKHFPDAPISPDIREYHPTGTVDIVWGSPPCQAASAAGKRKGTADSRWLWGDYFRVIGEAKPKWTIAENVYGLLSLENGLAFEDLCRGLENLGYSVRTYIIPALAVGACHRRDRVWIVGSRTGNLGEAATDSTSERRKGGGGQNQRRFGQYGGDGEHERGYWTENWPEVATRTCRVSYGSARRLYKFTRMLNHEYTNKTLTRQDLQTLWKVLQQKKVWEDFRGMWEIQEAEVLFEALCEFSGEPGISLLAGERSGQSVEEKAMREVWRKGQATLPPQRWESEEQYKEECPDSLSFLPFSTARAITTAWDCVRLLPPKHRLANGITISSARLRKERLKALGNSLVYPLVVKLFEAIKYAEENQGGKRHNNPIKP